MNIGTRVQYSTEYLKRLSVYTSEINYLRGTISEIKESGGIKFASVNWDNGQVAKVNVENLNKL